MQLKLKKDKMPQKPRNSALEAFFSWDNHLRDCKATRLESKGDGPPQRVANPCTYDGEKCPNGNKLHAAWLREIGVVRPTELRVEVVDGADGRPAGA